MSTTSLSGEDFSADALDHKLAAPEPASADRRARVYALSAAGGLHLALALLLVLIYAFAPRPSPSAQEIPVEVVVEPPPPPKPEPKKDEPKPKPAPEDERPAYDAPSAATAEKANRESPNDKTEAPAQAEPARELGAPQESQTPAAAREERTESPPPPETEKPVQEAERPAAETPAPAEGEKPAAAQTEERPSPPKAPKPPAPAPVGAPLPTAEVLPQYEFARAATESPVVGGNADTRYFTIVFGMIKKHLREPSGPRASRGGAVIFTVDEGGNLVERRLAASSGSPNLDMAVMSAIAQAAPYPPPPNWQPRSMKLVYGK